MTLRRSATTGLLLRNSAGHLVNRCSIPCSQLSNWQNHYNSATINTTVGSYSYTRAGGWIYDQWANNSYTYKVWDDSLCSSAADRSDIWPAGSKSSLGFSCNISNGIAYLTVSLSFFNSGWYEGLSDKATCMCHSDRCNLDYPLNWWTARRLVSNDLLYMGSLGCKTGYFGDETLEFETILNYGTAQTFSYSFGFNAGCCMPSIPPNTAVESVISGSLSGYTP
jgi:hypothetical protein